MNKQKTPTSQADRSRALTWDEIRIVSGGCPKDDRPRHLDLATAQDLFIADMESSRKYPKP